MMIVVFFGLLLSGCSGSSLSASKGVTNTNELLDSRSFEGEEVVEEDPKDERSSQKKATQNSGTSPSSTGQSSESAAEDLGSVVLPSFHISSYPLKLLRGYSSTITVTLPEDIVLTSNLILRAQTIAETAIPWVDYLPFDREFTLTPGQNSVIFDIIAPSFYEFKPVNVVKVRVSEVSEVKSIQTTDFVMDLQLPLKSLNAVSQVSASASGQHTCAVLSNGSVYCWGLNNVGQLGNGNNNFHAPSAVLALISNVDKIAAGSYHTCALLKTGKVSCWGSNHYGQLGDGTTSARNLPLTVPGLDNVIDITAFLSTSCALLNNGTIRCWGHGGSGQMGNGAFTPINPNPVSVSGITTATKIVLSSHACALLNDKTLSCWGSNQFGQLGRGWSGAPVSIADPVSMHGVIDVAVGSLHTCVLLEDTTVKCWGYNGFGQLGNGSTADSLLPVGAVGVSGTMAIYAGSSHTCALLASGEAKCWGDNQYGQLGNGDGGFYYFYSTPVEVADLLNISQLSLGWGHTCARLTNGRAMCWGRSVYGEVGAGAWYQNNHLYKPFYFGHKPGVKSVTAGGAHTCLLYTAGSAQCWGENGWGQLGLNHFNEAYVPTEVVGSNFWIQIAAGYDHTCGLLANGSVKCWGSNAVGKLGISSFGGNYTVPHTVSALDNAIAIALGDFHSCALLNSGTVKCWGDNSNSQLGSSSAVNESHTPVLVDTIQDAVQIAAGSDHTCALSAAGSVACWGSNSDGQLGLSTADINNYIDVDNPDPSVISTRPLPVSGLSSVKQIYARGYTTCAIRTNGELWCWGAVVGSREAVKQSLVAKAENVILGQNFLCIEFGGSFPMACRGSNGQGQLGVGTLSVASSSSFLTVSGISRVKAQAAGSSHACVITEADALMCWGSQAHLGYVHDLAKKYQVLAP